MKTRVLAILALVFLCFCGYALADYTGFDENTPNLELFSNMAYKEPYTEQFAALVDAYEFVCSVERGVRKEYFRQVWHPAFLAATDALIPGGYQYGVYVQPDAVHLYEEYIIPECPFNGISTFRHAWKTAAEELGQVNENGDVTADVLTIASKMEITEEAAYALISQATLYYSEDEIKSYFNVGE